MKKSVLRVVLTQQDGFGHTASSLVGAYYFFTTPFFIFGILCHTVNFLKQFKKKEMDLDITFFFWLVAAGIICGANSIITIIHINFIHIPIIF